MSDARNRQPGADRRLDRAADRAEVAERAVPPPAAKRRRRWGVLLAAAVVVGLGLGLVRVLWPETPPMESPAVPAEPTVRALEPVGAVEEFPRLFRWSSHPRAARYRFELMDLRGQRLHGAVTTQTFLETPGQLLESGRLPSSAMWKVVPLDGAGVELAASRVERFEVRRPPP